MTRDDLTKTAKRRLKSNQICPICKLQINDSELIVFTIKRKGRFKQYKFYHERCLINEEKQKTK